MNRSLAFNDRSAALSVRARTVPVVSTLAGSLVTIIPLITQAPILPPFGFMMLLAWRLLRQGYWPVWAPLPLGLFDDLVSGQPVGSSMLSWTVAFLVIDASERTLIWRDYLQDWFVAAAAIAGCLVAGYVFALIAGGGGLILMIVPQLVASMLLFPLVVRLCARLDQWRLR